MAPTSAQQAEIDKRASAPDGITVLAFNSPVRGPNVMESSTSPNLREVRAAGLAAVGGIGSARGLAKAYLRAHAAELSLDPSFFAAWGRSAGGYLAAMLGVTSGQQATEFDGDGPDGDSSVQAVVDWYGPSDFLRMDAQFIARPPDGDVPPVQNHDEPGSPESKWIGAPIQELPEVTARANPITYITQAGTPLPPFFLAAGTSDHLVPCQQTVILADALRAQGTPVVQYILNGARHADQRFESELTQPAIEWLEGLRQANGAGMPPSAVRPS
jgi:acetyl esterase/lipase